MTIMRGVFSCVWMIVLLTSLAAFTYCTVDCMYEYTSHRRHHSAVSQSQHHQQQRDDAVKLYLPTVTFCNLNPIRSQISTKV